MTEGKGLFESLLDFSFRECVTTKNLKFLYGLHLLVGLIAAIALVVSEFRTSISEGLLALIVGVIGLFFWILYIRITLEALLALFRIADAAAPSSGARER